MENSGRESEEIDGHCVVTYDYLNTSGKKLSPLMTSSKPCGMIDLFVHACLLQVQC